MSKYEPPITDVIRTSTGQRLFVAEWPGKHPAFVFAPGLTSTHRNIAGVAAALEGDLRVISIDLRGRGCSTKPPAGQYGMERHAEDVLSVMDELGIQRAIVGGHSMGAYVATAVAVSAPQRTLGLALIDGGVLLETPGVDADALLNAILKPVMERLRSTYNSASDYLRFWYSMAHMEGGPLADQYFLYDLGFTREGYRPKCSYDAAEEDWHDLLNNPATARRLASVKCPILAVGAEMGLTPNQASILSDTHLARLRELVADFDFVRMPGTTHYSLTLSEAGAAGVADALRNFARKLGP